MRDPAQGPGAAAQNAATAAENAQLDAQLELAAKKAALRSIEAQAGAPASVDVPAAPPLPPGTSRTTVVIQKDGQQIVLENPTAQQLREVGIATQQSPWNPYNDLDTGQKTLVLSLALLTVVGVTWIVAQAFRRGRGEGSSAGARATDARIERIENAIEAVAVEVERVSESQRYTARMLSEGAAQPVVGAAQGERVMRNNGEG